jgi:transcriptional regulator with XRE-family HTH domain
VLTTKELLARLRDKKVKNADIARVLNISPSRVTDLFNSDRALKLDEAAKLAGAFDLESAPSPQVPPLPGPVAQLIVQHIAQEIGRPLAQDAPQLRELSEDLRAFSEFVTDPKVRESIDLAMRFFQAMRLRRPAPEEVS